MLSSRAAVAKHLLVAQHLPVDARFRLAVQHRPAAVKCLLVAMPVVQLRLADVKCLLAVRHQLAVAKSLHAILADATLAAASHVVSLC